MPACARDEVINYKGMPDRLLETDKRSVLQLRWYPTVCASACAEVRGQVPRQASTRRIFPPHACGLQSLSMGFSAAMPLPGSSAKARDTATGPHQQQTAWLAVQVLQITVLFPQRCCALRLFQGNKHGRTLTWLCSFPRRSGSASGVLSQPPKYQHFSCTNSNCRKRPVDKLLS